jgi:tRNA/tmRNA/rRNA uracil-C5-methylase (TrmA/RlmC/RlmD family)
VLELTVGEAVHGGWCVARPDDPVTSAEPGGSRPGDAGSGGGAGMVIFVRHALPGERVRAAITQTTAKFARADAVDVIVPAPGRVSPPCPYARPGGCGGCDWQHASLPAQREFKGQIVSYQLRRIAGLDEHVTVEELPGTPAGLGWRTRVSFAVGRDGTAGLHRHRSHEIVRVADCLIAHPLVTGAEVTRKTWPGARSVEVTVAPSTGQRVVLARGGGRAGPDRRFLTQRAAGRDWRVAADGFWQVHPAAADVLAQAVLSALRPEPGETALDLFCGAGLFAGVLAEAVGAGGAVIAIERDAAAVRDARHNLRQTPWARVHRGDAAEVLSRIGLSGASVAVLDPPRTGLDHKLIAALCGSPSASKEAARSEHALAALRTGDTAALRTGDTAALRRIGYVSCDPATLARDIALMRQHGWRLGALRAFDAFPMTHHVECLATLVPAGAG